MRLLLDENLSPRVARALEQAGHDVVQVTEVGLGNTDDADILDAAADGAVPSSQPTRTSVRSWQPAEPRHRRW